MTIEAILQSCGDKQCEHCGAGDGVTVYEVPPKNDPSSEACLLVCKTYRGQIENPDSLDAHHWRCLNDSMWRLLNQLSGDDWVRNLLSMLYMEDELLT